MFDIRSFAGALALACGVASATQSAAAPADYRFELAGKPEVSNGKDVVAIRLVHVPDGKPVGDAVIFESRADMGPAGMAAMAAPIEALPAQDGLYRFAVTPGMTGTWALHLAAKVQGEPATVRGTVTAELVH